jgi:hypothetical protein
MCVEVRGSSAIVTSVIGTAVDEDFRLLACLPRVFGASTSSTKLFHASQFGHFPSHRADSYAHDWHTYFECALLMSSQYTQGASEIQREARTKADLVLFISDVLSLLFLDHHSG